MSKARRVELEDITIRNNYSNRLIEAKYILPPENPIFVADESGIDYGVPWLDCSVCSIRQGFNKKRWLPNNVNWLPFDLLFQ